MGDVRAAELLRFQRRDLDTGDRDLDREIATLGAPGGNGRDGGGGGGMAAERELCPPLQLFRECGWLGLVGLGG